jgi:hypothetical protein
MKDITALKSELNNLIFTYSQIPDIKPEDITEFKEYLDYITELKDLPGYLLTPDDKQELKDFESIKFDVEYELIKTLKSKLNTTPTKFSQQKIDKHNHYINTVSDIKKRSKNGIPLVENIKATKTFTIYDKQVFTGKKGTEIVDFHTYSDYNQYDINELLFESCYELLPYSAYNFYGCQYVKTYFNTIGKDYEYITPFIDYDLTTSDLSFDDTIDEALNCIGDFVYYVIPEAIDDYKLSIVGYSNVEALTNKFKNDGYIKIEHKPNSGKFLSLHITFPNVKIHVLELIARIEANKEELKEYKAFDIAPYKTGSLRHMASPKTGLTDHPEDKQVTILTNSEILDQFITYHNDKIKYIKIDLDFNNIHNKPNTNPINFNTSTQKYDVTLTYLGKSINNIEPIIKSLSEQDLIDISYTGRWSWLSKYVLYKKAINENITEADISSLIIGAHDHLESQIKFLSESKTFSPNPKPLLSYIKKLIPSEFEYTISSSNNYIKPNHFGRHKIEDMKNCDTYKEIIEVITGSFALSDEGLFYYRCINGVKEYKTTGRPNAYVAKFYPSKLILALTPEDLEKESTDEMLITLFKNRLIELGNQKTKKEIVLTADFFIKMLYKYYDLYEENGKTRFKLNGYSTETVKPDVYEDVKTIIKLFEDRLKPESKTENDNPLQEFLRSIKYLLVNGEKPEKAFLAIDTFGATGKSLFFSKIIKDFFGFAGLNDDSLNCLDSTFSDSYNYLYTVFNEVSKGNHSSDQCSTKLKQLTDNVIASARVKNVQNMRTFKNNGLYVLLSNSYDLNGALDINDTALMSRYVLIEFKPFETNDGMIDALQGNEHYKLIDKYKVYNDNNNIFSFDFRNALYKYIMDLDISKNTVGRAQPSKYKNSVYMDLAKDQISEIIKDKTPRINESDIYNVDLATKTLSKFNGQSANLIGFITSNLSGVSKKDINDFIKALNYKTAYYTRLRYKTIDIQLSDNRLKLVICEYSRFEELVEIEEIQPEI